MYQANSDLKMFARQKGVYLYELAEAWGICDTAMSRRLRKELTSSQKDVLMQLIEKIAEGKNIKLPRDEPSGLRRE